jgi:hypothetical protein
VEAGNKLPNSEGAFGHGIVRELVLKFESESRVDLERNFTYDLCANLSIGMTLIDHIRPKQNARRERKHSKRKFVAHLTIARKELSHFQVLRFKD